MVIKEQVIYTSQAMSLTNQLYFIAGYNATVDYMYRDIMTCVWSLGGIGGRPFTPMTSEYNGIIIMASDLVPDVFARRYNDLYTPLGGINNRITYFDRLSLVKIYLQSFGSVVFSGAPPFKYITHSKECQSWFDIDPLGFEKVLGIPNEILYQNVNEVHNLVYPRFSATGYFVEFSPYDLYSPDRDSDGKKESYSGEYFRSGSYGFVWYSPDAQVFEPSFVYNIYIHHGIMTVTYVYYCGVGPTYTETLGWSSVAVPVLPAGRIKDMFIVGNRMFPPLYIWGTCVIDKELAAWFPATPIADAAILIDFKGISASEGFDGYINNDPEIWIHIESMPLYSLTVINPDTMAVITYNIFQEFLLYGLQINMDFTKKVEAGQNFEFRFIPEQYGVLEGLNIIGATYFTPNQLTDHPLMHVKMIDMWKESRGLRDSVLFEGDVDNTNFDKYTCNGEIKPLRIWLDKYNSYKLIITPYTDMYFDYWWAIKTNYRDITTYQENNELDFVKWSIIELTYKMNKSIGQVIETDTGKHMWEGLNEPYIPKYGILIRPLIEYYYRMVIDFARFGNSYDGVTIPAIIQACDEGGGFIAYGMSQHISNTHLNSSFISAYLSIFIEQQKLTTYTRANFNNIIKDINKQVFAFDILQMHPPGAFGIDWGALHFAITTDFVPLTTSWNLPIYNLRNSWFDVLIKAVQNLERILSGQGVESGNWGGVFDSIAAYFEYWIGGTSLPLNDWLEPGLLGGVWGSDWYQILGAIANLGLNTHDYRSQYTDWSLYEEYTDSSMQYPEKSIFDPGYGWTKFGEPLKLRIPTSEQMDWEMFNTEGYLIRFPFVVLRNVTFDLQLDAALKDRLSNNGGRIWLDDEFRNSYQPGTGTFWMKITKDPYIYDGSTYYALKKEGQINEIEGICEDRLTAESPTNKYTLTHLPLKPEEISVNDGIFSFTMVPSTGYQYTYVIDKSGIIPRCIIYLFDNGEPYQANGNEIKFSYNTLFYDGWDYRLITDKFDSNYNKIQWVKSTPKYGTIFYVTYSYPTIEAKTIRIDLTQDKQRIALDFPLNNFIWNSFVSAFGGEVQIPYLSIMIYDADPDEFAFRNYGKNFHDLAENEKYIFYREHLIGTKFVGIPLEEDIVYTTAYKSYTLLERMTMKTNEWITAYAMPIFIIGITAIMTYYFGAGGTTLGYVLAALMIAESVSYLFYHTDLISLGVRVAFTIFSGQPGIFGSPYTNAFANFDVANPIPQAATWYFTIGEGPFATRIHYGVAVNMVLGAIISGGIYYGISKLITKIAKLVIKMTTTSVWDDFEGYYSRGLISAVNRYKSLTSFSRYLFRLALIGSLYTVWISNIILSTLLYKDISL